MKNTEIANSLLQKLVLLETANAAYRSIQAEAYKITVLEQGGGNPKDSLLNPVLVAHFSKGHEEIPAGRSELWMTFSSLPEEILQNMQDHEDDLDVRTKLLEGLQKADRVAKELEEGLATQKRKFEYYSERWAKRTAQWDHEAKLKKIWDENPGLPPFGASDILAGRKPEWDPIWNKGGTPSTRSQPSSSNDYEEPPWAEQARNDAIEERNYRAWKEGLHDYYHGPNSRQCGSIPKSSPLWWK